MCIMIIFALRNSSMNMKPESHGTRLMLLDFIVKYFEIES